jgi:hypothetical protein
MKDVSIKLNPRTPVTLICHTYKVHPSHMLHEHYSVVNPNPSLVVHPPGRCIGTATPEVV